MTAKNIDDVAQTLAEYERLAITSGAKVQIDPPEFSAGASLPAEAMWAPFWLDHETPPAVARATVHRDGIPTTIYVSWEESLPLETAQTDDGRLWRDLWEKNPMQRFGSYALRSALRRAFREVIGDRVEPDEDAPKVPAKDAEIAPFDWDVFLASESDVFKLDAVWKDKTIRGRKGHHEVAYANRRATLINAAWKPDADPSGSGHSPMRDTADESEADGGSVEDPSTHLIHGSASHPGRAPQDHLPGNRAERRAAMRQKRTKGGKP
jgi:hypothetical protein